jgi:hypothetical protein
VTTVIDIDDTPSEVLFHLAHLRRQQERQEAEERTARLAEVMWKPALGYYRKAKARL